MFHLDQIGKLKHLNFKVCQYYYLFLHHHCLSFLPDVYNLTKEIFTNFDISSGLFTNTRLIFLLLDGLAFIGVKNHEVRFCFQIFMQINMTVKKIWLVLPLLNDFLLAFTRVNHFEVDIFRALFKPTWQLEDVVDSFCGLTSFATHFRNVFTPKIL